MTCASCQAPLADGAAFCSTCGTPIRAAAPASTSAATPAPPLRTYSGLSTVAPMRERTGATLPPGAIFAHRYEVLSLIGEGGMGVVYLTRDTQSGDEVVLKLLHPQVVGGEQAVARLIREGLTARKITHKNIVRVYDVGQWEGQPFLTMEHVPGGTLRTWMTSVFHARQLVPFETAVGIVRALAAGLGEAHRMKFIHRDLKPENVLLASDLADGAFNLKILDFGIARAVDAPRSAARGPEGTPFYMAPEQLTAGDSAGPDADIYSLSAMFYELLVKVVPRGGRERVAAMRADVPPAIDTLFEKGLAQSPLGRFQSVDDFVAALDAVTQDARAVRDREAADAAARARDDERRAAEAARAAAAAEAAEAARRRADESRRHDEPQRLVDNKGPETRGWWARQSMAAKAAIIIGTLAFFGGVNAWNEERARQAELLAEERDRQMREAEAQRVREAAEREAVERAEIERQQAERLAAERAAQPTRRPAAVNLPPLDGTWYDSQGGGFAVRMNGGAFRGEAQGLVMTGTLNADGSGSFTIRDALGNLVRRENNAQLIRTSTGGIHINYENGSRTFWVNHTH